MRVFLKLLFRLHFRPPGSLAVFQALHLALVAYARSLPTSELRNSINRSPLPEAYTIVHINTIKMLTLILYLAGVIAFALFYKFIDWFEKI